MSWINILCSQIQFIAGSYGQGGARFSYHLPGFRLPEDELHLLKIWWVDAYEMIDGSEAEIENPYEGHDPRLSFSIMLPGTCIGNYLFNTEAQNHVGQPTKDFAMRKYSDILVDGEWPVLGEEDLNFILLRYADVLLAKALIETKRSLGKT